MSSVQWLRDLVCSHPVIQRLTLGILVTVVRLQANAQGWHLTSLNSLTSASHMTPPTAQGQGCRRQHRAIQWASHISATPILYTKCPLNHHSAELENNFETVDRWHYRMLLLLLSRFSCVRLCATPETAAHQAPPSLGFSRQEHWSGLPFPSPMQESEKWKRSRSVMSDS